VRAVDVIARKRDGGALTRGEIGAFVAAAASGAWPDSQIAALLMAIVLRGMTADETAWLTEAMVDSGSRVNLSALPGRKVDKHSTGGVGDKTSLVIAPIVAACGVLVPMMSGRGLGHTGGTLDKLEAIPGFRVGLSIEELKSALAGVGCAMIGQTAEIAPADRALYALRDVTATVESIPLISASIMSKKIAEGIDALVLDVKTGSGAFMKTLPDSFALAESLVAIGRRAGLRTEAVITGMDAPLGCAVGNALEVVECLEVLKGRGPDDLVDLSVALAARMLVAGGAAADRSDGARRARGAIASGAGLDRFRRMIERQGGDPRVVDDYGRLPAAPARHVVRAPRAGFVLRLDAGLVGQASVVLGAGRERAEDPVDHAVGLRALVKPGDAVGEGDAVLELHYRDRGRLAEALALANRALSLGESRPAPAPLIAGEVAA
jgi:pyrimidine-nucleoside phosphorylase